MASLSNEVAEPEQMSLVHIFQGNLWLYFAHDLANINQVIWSACYLMSFINSAGV